MFHDVFIFALLRIDRVMRPGGGKSYLFYLIVTARQNNLNSHMKIVLLMNYYLLSCDTVLINLHTDDFQITRYLMEICQFCIRPSGLRLVFSYFSSLQN